MPRKASTKYSQLLPVSRGASNQRAMLVGIFNKSHGACRRCDRNHPSVGPLSVDSLLTGTPSSTGSGTARLLMLLAPLARVTPLAELPLMLLALLARAIPLAELLLPLAVCGHLAHCLDVLRLKDEATILEEVYA